MQEEVTQKTIALSMKTGKLTTQALQAALKKYLQHRAKGPKLHHGTAKPKKPSIRAQLDAAKKEQNKQTQPREKTKELEV